MPNKITYTIRTSDGKEHQVSKENIDKYGIQSYADAYKGATIRMRDNQKGDYDIPLQHYDQAKQQGLRAFSFEHIPTPAKPSSAPKKDSGASADKPITAAEKAQMIGSAQGIQQDVQRGKQQLDTTMEYAKAKASNPLNTQKITLGEGGERPTLTANKNVVRGKNTFNSKTGKIEPTYITESGNVYQGDRTMADMEQNSIDTAKAERLNPVEQELKEAYAERERLAHELDRRGKELDAGAVDFSWRDMPRGSGGAVHTYNSVTNSGRLSDDEYKSLSAAKNQNEQRIIALEAERDKEGAGFWRGVADTLKNRSFWTFGFTDLMDTSAMLNYGGRKTQRQKNADRAMMENTYKNQVAQGKHSDNRRFMYGAGGIFANAVPFAIEFLATGGLSGATRAGAKLGAKVAENVATKALTKKLIKYTGTTLGDITAGVVMANTTGAARTASNIGQRHLGHVEQDAQGNYHFAGGEDWATAIRKGEVAQSLEYYTEKLGAHLEGLPVGKTIAKGLDKIGLSKVTKLFNRIGTSHYAQLGQKLVRRAGVNGYINEVTEEEANIILNSMLVGDNKMSNLFDGRTQADIWGGLLFSVGSMEAAPKLVGAVDYYRTKKGVKKADTVAGSMLTQEKWIPLREQIDDATNEQMADVVSGIIQNPELHEEEKKAALDYAGKLIKFRGFNTAMSAKAKEQEVTEDKDDETIIHQSMDNAYVQGHEASDEQKSDINTRYGYTRQHLSEALGIENTSDYTVDDYLANKDNMDDKQKEAAIDYLNAKAAYNGMIQRVKDEIDNQISESHAIIEERQHADGKMYPATMKVDDRKVYIVGGNAQMNEDGTGIDHDKSSDSVMVRDAQTGKMEMVSPSAILAVDEPIDAEEEKAAVAERIRQIYAQLEADKIDGKLSFHAGETYSVVDEDGAQHTMQVVGDAVDEKTGQPMPDMVMVNVDGAQRPTMLPKEQVQQMSDADNAMRLEQSLQQREEARTAEQQSTHTYNLNDELTLTDEQGNPMRGSITAEPNEDGQFEVYTERPINGKKVNLLTAEEIDALNAEVPEQNATVANNARVEQTDDKSVENLPQNAGNSTETHAESAENLPQQPTALERIPTDEQGQPLYEQAEPEAAWDAILEQADGNEAIAQNVADDMVSETEAAVKRAEKTKARGGTTVAEKIAAEKERAAAIEQAKATLAHWKKIAAINHMRQASVQLEKERKVQEAALLRKEQEEKERAEREEAERIKREALNGVPDFVEDKASDARARGYRRVNGDKVDRQQPLTPVRGKEVQVKFDDANIPTGHVALIDADELQPSHKNGQRNPLHFIDEAQPKERKDNASVGAARKIAANIRPEEITSSVTAYTGAPAVNGRGEVIQGNNRSAALREMWDNHKEQGEKYKQYLIDHADELGLNAEDVAAMEKPVLVNMLDVTDDEAIALGQFVASDTESGGTERIKPKNVVKKLGDKMKNFANILLRSSDEDLSFSELIDRNGMDVLKWMSVNGTVTPTQYKSAFDNKGNLTAEAKNDLKGVMYQSIFEGGSTQLEEMFNVLPAKAQKAILATAYRDYDSPQSERMVEEIQNSIMAYYDLSHDAQFIAATNHKDARIAVEIWKRQLAFDDVTGESFLPSEKYSNFALLLATMYKGDSQSLIQGTFNKLFDLIQGLQEESLFEQPDNTPRTLAQSIKETLNIEYDGQQRSNVLVGDTPASQQGQQGSDGIAAPGGRSENGDGAESHQRGAEADSGGSRGQGNMEFLAERQDNPGETEEVKLSDEVDEDGSPFVKTSTGTTVFGEIREDSGLTPAPIKLSLGNSKYGLTHIEKRHGDQIRSAGFTSAEEFVEFVCKNYKRIQQGENSLGEQNGTYLLQIEDDHNNTLYVELSSDGTYWGVNSGGVFRKGYGGNKREVWSAPEVQSEQSVADSTLREEDKSDNPTSPNGNVPTTSTDKDNESSGTKQENNEKTSENPSNREDLFAMAERVAAEDKAKRTRKKEEGKVDTNPTEAQKEAGNYKKGHIKVDGMDVTIERPKGSVRTGKDENGKEWRSEMHHTYGYIRGTESVDGDHIDIFLSDNPAEGNVFVVDQVNKDGSFDEHKVMYGFFDIESAKQAYLSNYEEGWQGLGNITEVTRDEFKKWIDSSKRKTKPFAEYASVKKQSSKPTAEQGTDNELLLQKLRSAYPDRVLGEQHRDGSVTFHDEDALLVSELLDIDFDGTDLTLPKDKSDDALLKLITSGHKVAYYGEEYKPNAEQLDFEELKNFQNNTDTTGRTAIDADRYDAEELFVPLLLDGKPSKLGVLTVVPDKITDPASQIAIYDYSDEIDDKTNSGWQKWGDLTDEYNKTVEDKDKAKERGDTATLGFRSVSAAVRFNDWLQSKGGEHKSNKDGAAGTDLLFRDGEPKHTKEEQDAVALQVKQPIEQSGSLVALHNLSEEKLQQALELGGFPMPSIAITKANIGHTEFGNISLLFGKDSINPTDKRNKVYSGDAWTPTFPSVGYKLNSEKTSDIYRRANNVGSLPLFRPVLFHPDNYENKIDGQGSNGLVEHFKDDYGAKQMFLYEKGNAVEKFVQHEVEKYSDENVKFFKKILETIGLERLKNESYDSLENEMKKLLGQYYDIDFDTMKPFRAKTRINSTIQKAIDYVENGNNKIENDIAATEEKIDERIEQKEFRKWLEKLFAGVVEKKGIRNEQDMFTPSGNRRKWENLYDAVTLDNAIKAMQTQAKKGGTGLFGGSIFGASAKELKEIEDIRNEAKLRINPISEEDYQAEKDRITERLEKVTIPSISKSFSDAMGFIENVQDAVSKSHTAKGIYRHLHSLYPDMTMEVAKEIEDIVKDIQKISTRYLEAKPYRAVSFDEVKAAVVPSDTNSELIQQLKDRGIEVSTYEKDNQEQRKQIVNEVAIKEELLFRNDDGIDVVNERFNEELAGLTEENADKVALWLGNPSDILLSAGVENKPMKLYGNKVIKKMKKHGFALEELRDLPKAVANPIAVFNNYGQEGNRTILTELQSQGKNIMVAVTLGKNGVDVDFNIVSSVFGKGENNIADWINKGYLSYVNKEKALNYLHFSERRISEASEKPELLSAAKVVKDFENPSIGEEKLRRGNGSLSDEELSFINDPVAKMRGKSARTEQQRKEFAAHERQKMAERAQELADALHLDNVEVVTDATRLEGKRAKAKGFYTKSSDKITIVIPNHTDIEDVEATLLHEAVAHYGLRKLFGEHFDTFLDNVFQQAEPQIRHEIVQLARKRGWDFRVATEEYLASLAENTNFEKMPDTFWSKIKRLFLDMLHSIGFEHWKGGELSDNELRYILWRSYENLREPGRYRSILGEAEDIAKQKELKVGNYAETKEDVSVGRVAEEDVDTVNRRFNEDLDRQISGTLPKGYVYEMGRPSRVLQSAGIPNLPIELVASRLSDKAMQENHPFDLSEVKDLPKAIQNPLAVFRSATHIGSNVVLTELKQGGKNYVVAIETNRKAGRINVNSVRSVHYRNSLNIVGWVNDGLADYMSDEFREKWMPQTKNELLSKPQYNSADVRRKLISAAKIVKDFENPSIEEENLYRDGAPEERERHEAREVYEQRVNRAMFQTQEALQDSMLGLREAMDAIMKAEGKKKYVYEIDGFENPYLGENRLSSVNKAEADAFAHLVFKPLLDEVSKLANNDAERAELTDYMMAKHGLERNEVMANRDAEEAYNAYAAEHPNSAKTLDDFIAEARQRDYAGLTALTGMDSVADAEAEAKQMVNSYEATHDTGELWAKTKAATMAILSKSYECGMMNKETYERIKGMYDYYIPLRGFDEKTSGEAYAYLSHQGSAFNAPIKTAKGRSSKADDPFANMQSMAESAITQGNRNKLVKQRFLNFVLNHPSDLVSVSDLWLKYDPVSDEWKPVFPDNIDENDTADDVERKMTDFEERMKTLAEQEPDKYKHGKDAVNIPYRVVESRDLRQHQVLVKRNGRDYVLTINGNPRAAQALNGQTNPDNDTSGAIGAILKAGEMVNRQLSAFYTTRNPDFVVSNFIRDMLYANSMVWVKERPNYALRFHRNIGRCNPVQMKILLTKHRKGELDMNNPLEQTFYQFMMNGGETGYANIRDIERHKNDIRRELKRANGKLGIARAINLLGERLDEYNRAVENSARFAAYLTSREMGRSVERSIYDAKEISVNFNKKGSGAKFMRATAQTKLGSASAFVSGLGRSGFVFWNAAIQGTTNFGRQFQRHPAKAFTATAVMFLLGATVACIGMGDDDSDEDKNSYWNLPEYIRRSNILFRVGDQWVSIPLPVEYRSIYGMGELMVSAMSGKEHFNDMELGKAIAGQATQVLPIDFLEGGGGIKAFIPSAVKPFAEVYSNKGWTGMPLYKDTPYNQDMPEWTKAYKSANKYLVGLSKVLNEKTGGDAYTKGFFDINPAKVEYLLNGYFGGVSNTIDKLTKSAETIAGQREYDPKSFLLLNRVLKNGDERTEARAINNEYLRVKKEHDQIKSRMKHYEEDTNNGVFDYAEKINFLYNSPEYARYEVFEAYQKDIDGLYEELKETVNEDDRKFLESELTELEKQMIEEMNETRK